MTPHTCDEGCVCPDHETPLIYSPAWDEHACQDVTCVHGHGMVLAVSTPDYPGRSFTRTQYLMGRSSW